jgi:hypothetical protein
MRPGIKVSTKLCGIMKLFKKQSIVRVYLIVDNTAAWKYKHNNQLT